MKLIELHTLQSFPVSCLIPAAFLAVRQDPKDDGDLVRRLLKQRVEEERFLQRLPKDLAALFETDEAAPQQAGARPASALYALPVVHRQSQSPTRMTVLVANDTPPAATPRSAASGSLRKNGRTRKPGSSDSPKSLEDTRATGWYFRVLPTRVGMVRV
jgi:hypothetical protein